MNEWKGGWEELRWFGEREDRVGQGSDLSTPHVFSQCDPQRFSTDKHYSPTGEGREKIGDWDGVGARKD